MCQKLRTLIGSRQNYWNNNQQLTFYWATLYKWSNIQPSSVYTATQINITLSLHPYTTWHRYSTHMLAVVTTPKKLLIIDTELLKPTLVHKDKHNLRQQDTHTLTEWENIWEYWQLTATIDNNKASNIAEETASSTAHHTSWFMLSADQKQK